MSESMMQEILKRLDTIGAKLGEGAEFAWRVSIKQQMINNGILNLIISAVLLAVCWALVKILRSPYPTDSEDYNGLEDETRHILKVAGCGAGTAITFVWGLIVLYEGLVHVINPQYYALMDLARLLGK